MSGAYSSLQLVIPALEQLHKKLPDRLSKSKYMPFVLAIRACLEIIEKYHGHTEYMDVYIMAMGKSLSELFFFILVMYFIASA